MSHSKHLAHRRRRLNLIGISLGVLALVLFANQWRNDTPELLSQNQTIPVEIATETEIATEIEITTVNTTAKQAKPPEASTSKSKETSLFSRWFKSEAPSPKAPAAISIDKAFLRNALSQYIASDEYPSTIKLNQQNLNLEYTLDPALQAWAKKRLKRYNPDYGAFIALDPDTGKILAMVNNHRTPTNNLNTNLNLQGTFPAASTFKLITAAAMLEENLAKPETVYAFNGKSTTLYKKQVFSIKENKWTRRMNLKTAFAKSVNPIFGRLGANELGAQTLFNYAERFGFNAKFITDFEFDNGSIELDFNDKWQAAESASGFTKRNTLSPIHGALLAASVINGGKLISPSIVQSVHNDSGELLYQSSNTPGNQAVLKEENALALQKLMAATTKFGTARKTFRNLSKKRYKDVKIGGKSGHLSGLRPKGNYDWFIGYGERGEQKIAYAMLCINKEKWYVKSSQFASEALAFYFKNAPTKITDAGASKTPESAPSS